MCFNRLMVKKKPENISIQFSLSLLLLIITITVTNEYSAPACPENVNSNVFSDIFWRLLILYRFYSLTDCFPQQQRWSSVILFSYGKNSPPVRFIIGQNVWVPAVHHVVRTNQNILFTIILLLCKRIIIIFVSSLYLYVFYTTACRPKLEYYCYAHALWYR